MVKIRRRSLAAGALWKCIGAAAFLVISTCWLGIAAGFEAPDYYRLVDLIRLQDRETPLCVFADFEEGSDATSQRANLSYLNSHPGLIKKIRAELKGAALRWRLKLLRSRLLFVPEQRKEYAVLYENYCRDVIRFMLAKTDFADPFQDIQTLGREKPQMAAEADGVRVFLVHNLAREFEATNIFTCQKARKAEVKIHGKIFIGNIGSYSSHLEILPDGSVAFSRNRYTIWQNSAKNPYTALMTPAEETLHVLLRPYTERLIEEKIARRRPESFKPVEAIVEEQVAVEEAVAGGLVYHLLPLFFDRWLPGFPGALIAADLNAKMKLHKYRYLRCAIGLIEQVGYRDFLDGYKSDPAALARRLRGSCPANRLQKELTPGGRAPGKTGA